MTFLDNKGVGNRDGLSSGKGDSAVRTVKAKREADEAGAYCLECLSRGFL